MDMERTNRLVMDKFYHLFPEFPLARKYAKLDLSRQGKNRHREIV